MKLIANNPIANYQYFLLDKYEAGIVLTGDEIKSIRAGHVSIKEAFVHIKNNEAWLKNAYIQAYDKAFDSRRNKADERKDRKLLLHKNEILRIKKSLEQEGLTLVPVKIYFEGAYAKVEIAIAKGKKLYDKRETIKKREIDRKLKREM
ncbi:MAG: SsrA-binding protein SmpB [Clostridia bacterium]|nr:SsrA-binding protein SmpB [Clostridia bacterium]